MLHRFALLIAVSVFSRSHEAGLKSTVFSAHRAFYKCGSALLGWPFRQQMLEDQRGHVKSSLVTMCVCVCVCVSVLSSCLSFWVGVLCGSVRDCLHVAVCALCREGDGRSCTWPWSQTPSPAQNSGLFLPDLWMARFLLTLCIPEASACLSAMARQGSQTVWKGPMDVLAGFCLGCYLSFPGGASGKEPACQCRGHKRRLFDP